MFSKRVVDRANEIISEICERDLTNAETILVSNLRGCLGGLAEFTDHQILALDIAMDEINAGVN
jgi:hypothetical protein